MNNNINLSILIAVTNLVAIGINIVGVCMGYVLCIIPIVLCCTALGMATVNIAHKLEDR